MSLKAFHIFFVALCLVLSVGVGLWAVNDYRLTAKPASLAVGCVSFGAFMVLAVYGGWFLRKLRSVSLV